MGELAKLNGLGLKTEQRLNEIGVLSAEELKTLGAIPAYLKLKDHFGSEICLNFLYALVAAIENRSWQEVAQNDKGELLYELEGYQEIQDKLAENESE